MTIKEILANTEHRPWGIPQTQWKYYQEWNDALFLHWQVDLNELKSFVPESLEIDLFEGKAWVSLVAFSMEKIRPRYLPAFSPISDFHEINIRTYVKNGSKTGVYFMSIEGGTRLSCTIARKLSDLPYRYSKMKRLRGAIYSSENSQYDDRIHIQYEVGPALKEKTSLDKWLTERYALFQDIPSGINEFEIHHPEWPLYNLDISEMVINYPRFKMFMKKKPDRMHYSPGVQVIAWNKSKI